MKDNGRTIKLMVEASMFMGMELSMMESGKKTNNMG
jgi:hypothetical protein